MTRIAHCCCGSLRAETTGEPVFVGACHCTECQRRTGSPVVSARSEPQQQCAILVIVKLPFWLCCQSIALW